MLWKHSRKTKNEKKKQEWVLAELQKIGLCQQSVAKIENGENSTASEN